MDMGWNVVVTVYDGELRRAKRLLAPFGLVERTDFRNVLVMRVDDVNQFMSDLTAAMRDDASIANSVSRIVPVADGFRFQSPEEFESKACDTVMQWVPALAGKRFHVRMYRRGFKGRLSSQHEEQFLDHHILEALRRDGRNAEIDFEDPDAILVIETVGQSAGLACWSRAQLLAFPMMRLD
jgi:tRNA(Ser,Leu) C12 N-acetylase TAN1